MMESLRDEVSKFGENTFRLQFGIKWVTATE